MSTETLIRELAHNATASGNRPLERHLADVAIWFHRNKSRIPLDNLAAKQRFLEKGFEVLLEINALLLERVREVDGANKRSQNLWLPRGMMMDEKEFA